MTGSGGHTKERKMKWLVSNLLKPLCERVFSAEAGLSAAWAFAAHRRLFWAQWRLPPNPEYFDHKLDLYWQWNATRSAFWLERGVYSSLALKPDSVALELCCGDGFNAYSFYSRQTKSIVAVDFDRKAIAYAQRNFQAPNLSYRVADIRNQMPEGDFDNVIWDAAIEHFTENEIESLMKDIKSRLAAKNGILSGYTLVERDDGEKHLHQHEYEFRSKDDLARFLKPRFRNVTVFETLYPERHNLYFWASDTTIPFGVGWPQKIEA
jgi:ubiquinone/menaquinone biosynthesis C-methylase UbiE